MRAKCSPTAPARGLTQTRTLMFPMPDGFGDYNPEIDVPSNKGLQTDGDARSAHPRG